MTWSNQPTPETDIGNRDLHPELEGGSEFDIIYFDDDGILVKRGLLALNDSKHLQLDLIRWMKNAEQRKFEQQQLQLQPEGESTSDVLQQDFVPKDKAGSEKLLETPIEEILNGPLPLAPSAEQEGDAAQTPETDIGNLNLDIELVIAEGGSEFDIIYYDDWNGILVERDLVSLNQHLQLDKIQWIKNAEQAKLEQQQLEPEGESTAAVLQQDFVLKNTAESEQEQGKVIIAGSSFGGAAVASCSSWSPPEGYPKWDFNWDKRAPNNSSKPSKKKSGSAPPSGKDQADYSNQQEKQEQQKEKSKATRHIFLIRHGQYNQNGKYDCDKSLTKLGERQAEETGKRLKSLGLDFYRLNTSTVTRAVQTAEIIQKVIGQPEIIIKDFMLREGTPAQAEPPFSGWHPKPHRIYEDGPRIEAAFHTYFHRAKPTQTEDSYEIIVCHANVIRYFFCRALQFPGEAWSRICLNHASITYLNITQSGRVIVRALGDSGHLEPEMLTNF